MIELKGKNYRKDYEKYEEVIKNNCSFISKEEKFKGFSREYIEISRYLCPCGIVKITTGLVGTQPIKIESDVCGFK